MKLHNERLNLYGDIVSAMNALDSFAVYFVKEIADEKIAYSSLGYTFVKSIESLYFDISIGTTEETNNPFGSVISLYNVWSKRLKKERLQKSHDATGFRL